VKGAGQIIIIKNQKVITIRITTIIQYRTIPLLSPFLTLKFRKNPRRYFRPFNETK
jgi:hypothetical protein